MSSCLDIKVTRITEKVHASVQEINVGKLEVNLVRLGAISVKFINEKTAFIISNDILNSALNIQCGIVCGIADTNYLLVTPKELQWITENTEAAYKVVSNVDWTIEKT